MSEKKTVSIQEIAVSNMVSIEAIIRVLVRKGLITQEEILEEVKDVADRNEANRN